MRLKNRKIEREYCIVKVPRKNGEALEFKVAGIPMSLDRDFATMCPHPRPPVVSTVGKKAEPNYDDPAYDAAFSNWSDLKKYYQLYVVLQYDENVEFPCVPTDTATLQTIRKGILDSGLSVGDIGIILKAAMDASNLTDEVVDAAKRNF